MTLPSEFRMARGLRTFSVTGYGKSELVPVFFFGQSSLGPQVYPWSNAGQSNFSILKMSFSLLSSNFSITIDKLNLYICSF